MKEKRIKRTNKWHTRRGGGRLENSPSTEKNKNESAGHTHRFFFSSTTAQGNQRIIFNFVFCFFFFNSKNDNSQIFKKYSHH
jgi:hypothetical protein